MKKNQLLIAGAGTGKTKYLIESALNLKDEKTLITTFTINCKNEIKEKIIKQIGYIPNNITIQTWFSFLLEHGIMPYKKSLGISKVNGILLVEGKSALRYYSKSGFPVYWGDENIDKCYFSNEKKIYTDKLAKLFMKINNSVGNKVVNRIEKIYDNIFIDEVQDMIGYDLEIIKELMKSSTKIKIVGDPRQKVYSTHTDSKYKKYEDGNIDEFINNECNDIECDIDTTTLTTCYRCYNEIINFVNSFYDKYEKLKSINIEKKIIKEFI